MEYCWSLVHFSEMNMKFASVISRTWFIQIRRNPSTLSNSGLLLRKSVTFCTSGCARLLLALILLFVRRAEGKVNVLE